MKESSVEKLIQLAAAANRQIEYTIERCVIRAADVAKPDTVEEEQSAVSRPEAYHTVPAYTPVTLKPGDGPKPDYLPVVNTGDTGSGTVADQNNGPTVNSERSL